MIRCLTMVKSQYVKVDLMLGDELSPRYEESLGKDGKS